MSYRDIKTFPACLNIGDLGLLKQGIWLGVIGSTVLHAVTFALLTRAAAAPQIEQQAMETFIVVPSPALARSTPQPAQRVSQATIERRDRASERTSTTEQERSPSAAATANNMHPESRQKSEASAFKPVPAAPAAGKVGAATSDVPVVSATSQLVRQSSGSPSTAAAPDGAGSRPKVAAPSGAESPSSAAAPNGAETIAETSLGDAGAPRFIHREAPVYPVTARKLGKEGNVVLRLTLNERGEQKEIRIVAKGGFGFTEAAVDAVKKSTFSPALKGGKPVVSRVVIPVRFVLKEE